VGIDPQGNRRRAVAKAPADCNDINTCSDQRRGVRVTQRMEAGRRQLAIPHRMAPIPRQLVGRIGRAVRHREHQIVIAEASEPEREAVLELTIPVFA
jgi:hypothetical protein